MAIVRLPWEVVRLVAVSFAPALGRIWANRVRSVLTVTGIVIAVAAVVATIGALTGMERSITDQFAKAGANRADIWPMRPDTGSKKNAPWARINLQPDYFDNCLERCPAFTRLTRVCFDDAAARHGSHTIENARLWGVEPGWGEIQNRAVLSGRFFSTTEENTGQRVCCVTPEARDKLMLDREPEGERIIIGRRTFLVVGVVEPEPQAGAVMFVGTQRPQIAVPFRTLHKGQDDWVEASLTMQSAGMFEEAEAQIRFFLRGILRLAPGEPDTFGVWNAEKNRTGFEETSKAITAVAIAVVCVSLLVGGIGVANVMFVSVTERTREIGLRKAVGARPAAILLQFLIEATALSLMGGAIGVAAGYGLTALVARIPNFPAANAAVPAWAVALALSLAGGTGVLAGTLPAVKAARLDPIAALRHD